MAAGGIALPLAARRKLQQPRRDEARLGEQEPADLRDMRAGGDVDEIVLLLGIEGIGAGEIPQLRINLAEIPGVAHADQMPPDLGCRRNLLYVGDDLRRQPLRMHIVDEFQPVDEQPLLLAQRHCRPPSLPTVVSAAGIERRSKDAYRNPSSHLISLYKYRYHRIILQTLALARPEARYSDQNFSFVMISACYLNLSGYDPVRPSNWHAACNGPGVK